MHMLGSRLLGLNRGIQIFSVIANLERMCHYIHGLYTVIRGEYNVKILYIKGSAQISDHWGGGGVIAWHNPCLFLNARMFTTEPIFCLFNWTS